MDKFKAVAVTLVFLVAMGVGRNIGCYEGIEQSEDRSFGILRAIGSVMGELLRFFY